MGKKIILISMLPGLGKSTLAKGNSDIIDYEDWMESHDLQYKNENDRDTINHLNIMIQENLKEDTIIVFSSIHWEDLGEGSLDSNLLIHMKPGLYNKQELDNRGRQDLGVKFSDEELKTWNDDYVFLSQGKKTFLLDKEEYINIDHLKSAYLSGLGYDITTDDTVVIKN